MPAALPAELIDSHHHFWTGNPHFSASDYMPEHYLKDSAVLHDLLRATVFVECNTHYDLSLPKPLQAVGETRFAAAVGEQFHDKPIQLAAAIVGHADPMAEGVPFAEVVEAHVAAGKGRLRALRRSVAWDRDDRFNYPILRTQAHMLVDDRFMQAASIMADRGIVFETWAYHPQLGELARLAAAVPDCTIILDHAGTALSSGSYAGWEKTWDDWKEGMASLAAHSNVSVKIGGLITAGSRLDQQRQAEVGGLSRWTVSALAQALRPWLSHLIAHFGPQRCLFESNFPVDRAYCSWSTLVLAYVEALNGLDDESRDAIFSGNAARLYGLAR